MSDKERFPSAAQARLVVLALALTAAGVLYRLLVFKHLEQTSALFIGVPALLAIALSLTPKASTTAGGILKAIALGLLLSGPLLGEGFICILMASPLFFGVGLAVGLIFDHYKKKARNALAVLVVLVPMSTEGTAHLLSFDRDETVQVAEVVPGSAREVERALEQSPRTDLPLPFYLTLEFPRPVEASGSGLQKGSPRVVHFAGGEGRPGDLVLTVEDSRPGFVLFRVVSDGSKVAHWLDWKSSAVVWSAVDAHHTKVSWTIRYERRLDPAWYFGPWERYAVRLAASYLIQSNATPSPGRS